MSTYYKLDNINKYSMIINFYSSLLLKKKKKKIENNNNNNNNKKFKVQASISILSLAEGEKYWAFDSCCDFRISKSIKSVTLRLIIWYMHVCICVRVCVLAVLFILNMINRVIYYICYCFCLLFSSKKKIPQIDFQLPFSEASERSKRSTQV